MDILLLIILGAQLKLFANIFKITSTKQDAYPGDIEGDSIIATGEASASKGETAQVYGMPGLIANPPTGIKGVRFKIGSLDIIIGALNYQVPLPADPGETKVYSTDADGAEQATAILKPDGTMEINGNADFAVAFNDLKSGFDTLKSDFNTFLTHVHGGSGTPPVPPAVPSTASVDASKISTIKVP